MGPVNPEKLRDEDLRLAQLLEQALSQAQAHGGPVSLLEEALRLAQERNLLLLKSRSTLLDEVTPGELDELTHLPNAKAFSAALERALAEEGDFSVVFFSIDQFEQLSNLFSAALADEVVLRVAGLVTRALRRGDVAGRLEDGSFGLILRGATGDRAFGVCERLRMAVFKQDWNTLHPGLKVTLSLGHTGRSGHRSASEVLARARLLQAEASSSGQNQTFPGSYY